MINFLAVGIALLLVWLGTKIISWVSLRAGILALAAAGVIFLMGMLGH